MSQKEAYELAKAKIVRANRVSTLTLVAPLFILSIPVIYFVQFFDGSGFKGVWDVLMSIIGMGILSLALIASARVLDIGTFGLERARSELTSLIIKMGCGALREHNDKRPPNFLSNEERLLWISSYESTEELREAEIEAGWEPE